MILKIKPLTINQAWQGRRYKSKKYKRWREEIDLLLLQENKKGKIEEGYLWIDVTFYIKYWATSDEANFLKTFFDALVQNEVIEDDRYIVGHSSKKVKVDKSEDERIEFDIKHIKGKEMALFNKKKV